MKPFIFFLISASAVALTFVRADETCSSPYLARIDGEEEFVYVWTLGVEGLGDGSDKLVTVDVKPGSPNYGKIIDSVSVGGGEVANTIRHMVFHAPTREIWFGTDRNTVGRIRVPSNAR